MRRCHFILALALLCTSWCEPALAATKRPAKPAKQAASGEMICQLQSPCRPVRPGCHLQRIGQYNEEVCKDGGGRTP